MPCANVEGDDVAWIGGDGLAGYVGECPRTYSLCEAPALRAAQQVRSGNNAQGAGVGVDRVEVEDEFDCDLVFVRGVGVPTSVADIAVYVNSDTQYVGAAEPLGGAQKTEVLHQRGSEWRVLVGQAGP